MLGVIKSRLGVFSGCGVWYVHPEVVVRASGSLTRMGRGGWRAQRPRENSPMSCCPWISLIRWAVPWEGALGIDIPRLFGRFVVCRQRRSSLSAFGTRCPVWFKMIIPPPTTLRAPFRNESSECKIFLRSNAITDRGSGHLGICGNVHVIVVGLSQAILKEGVDMESMQPPLKRISCD